MFTTLGLDHLTPDALLFLCVGVGIGGVLAGYVADAVMGPLGFGPFGNAILTILGAVVGLAARNTWFDRLYAGELALTAFLCAASATLMLIAFGFAKRYLET